MQAGFGKLIAFSARRTNIVRELIGSVKQRMEADIPIHPGTTQCSIKATRRSVEILAPFHKSE